MDDADDTDEFIDLQEVADSIRQDLAEQADRHDLTNLRDSLLQAMDIEEFVASAIIDIIGLLEAEGVAPLLGARIADKALTAGILVYSGSQMLAAVSREAWMPEVEADQ